MKRTIFKSKFLRNVLVMVSGAAGAQLIAFILSPIITRLYGPEAFGIMGTFAAIVNILIPVAALTYPIAIVMPKEDEEAKGIIKLSLIVSSFLSLILFVILILFKDSIVSVLNLKEIAPYILLVPIVIIFTGLLQVTEQWLIRKGNFTINAKVHFTQALIVNGGKAGLGFLYPIAPILIFFQVIANGLRAFMMMFYTKGLLFEYIQIFKSNKLSIRKLGKKYKDFPLFRAPEVFISATSQNLPLLLLTSLVGPAATGFYSIGRTVLALPARLIGESVGDVFYPRIVDAVHNKENVSNLILKATLALAAVGLIPFGLIMLIGPFLFELVFGAGWEKAGEYARWIALTSYAIFIARPSVKSLPILHAQKMMLNMTILILIFQSSSLVLGFYVYKSDLVAIAFFGISGLILNLLLILMTISRAKKINLGN